MAITGLQVDEVLDYALIAFRRSIIPLRVFGIAFNKGQEPLRRGGTMKVPYYPLVSGASTDFNGTYDFTNAGPAVSSKDVTVNKRKYQPIITTSTELARFNYSPEQIGRLKGDKLAVDVMADVLSLVTLANFGAAAFTGAASTFDADDVADLQQVCDEAEWPDAPRNLVIKPAYRTALVKDNAVQAAYAYGDDDPIKEGRVDRIHGFDTHPSNGIPANGQNLVGFVSHPSAILVGFSPIEPAESVRKMMTDYRVVEDPDTGITIEYRAWGDPDTDSHKEVIEVNYGYALGETAALKRIVSA